MLFRFFVLQVKWTSHVMVKTPCTCRSPTRVTCTVSQQFGVFQTVTTAKNHLQELSRAASSNGVRHKCQDMLFVLNMWTAPTRSSAACKRILMVSNKTHEKTHLCVDRACACLSVFDSVKTPTSTAADHQEKCMRKCPSCAVHSKFHHTRAHW